MNILIGAIVLWIVPLFVANSIGKSKRRAGLIYGLFLGWIGVLILAILPALPEPTAAEQLEALDRQRGQYKASYIEQKKAELQAQLAAAETHRECPFCKESMRKDATVCPHCRHESPAAANMAESISG